MSGNDAQQPGKHGGMNYGALGRGRGKSGTMRDREEDPNIVPRSSMFGFLESLPWKIGGRGSRYRPGVADLQENVGKRGAEAAPLIGHDNTSGRGRHGRSRSDTVNSKSTTNSLSSRGDLFPSEDEDDAVPLDDEFAMVLERRTTTMSDEHSSRQRSGKRPSGSRRSTKSATSKEARDTGKEGRSMSDASVKEGLDGTSQNAVPSMIDLKQEEDRVSREQEARLVDRRQAAQKLAAERGLDEIRDEFDPKSSIHIEETPVLSPKSEESAMKLDPENPGLSFETRSGEQISPPDRNPGPEPKPPD